MSDRLLKLARDKDQEGELERENVQEEWENLLRKVWFIAKGWASDAPSWIDGDELGDETDTWSEGVQFFRV